MLVSRYIFQFERRTLILSCLTAHGILQPHPRHILINADSSKDLRWYVASYIFGFSHTYLTFF